jgi:hypothetical protein
MTPGHYPMPGVFLLELTRHLQATLFYHESIINR